MAKKSDKLDAVALALESAHEDEQRQRQWYSQEAKRTGASAPKKSRMNLYLDVDDMDAFNDLMGAYGLTGASETIRAMIADARKIHGLREVDRLYWLARNSTIADVLRWEYTQSSQRPVPSSVSAWCDRTHGQVRTQFLAENPDVVGDLIGALDAIDSGDSGVRDRASMMIERVGATYPAIRVDCTVIAALLVDDSGNEV